MNGVETSERKPVPSRQVVNIALQLLVLGFLISFCFRILAPFVEPILWAAIFAVALFPLQQKLTKILKGKNALASVCITIAMLAIFIVPATWLMMNTASEAKEVLVAYRNGNLTIPPPTEKVKEWPVIGNKVYSAWQDASSSVDSLTAHYPEKVRIVVGKSLALLSSTAKGVLFLALAIIISGVLMSYATQAGNFAKALFNKLMNSDKIDVASIAVVTIRNVVKGILGVAVVQSTLAAIGMAVGGVPYVGIWTLLCLVLAIVQIGTLPVAIGVIIYIWSAGTTTTAILLTIWMLAVGLLDNILKPLVMGKGAPVPMLVIFLGAIGGFMVSGFIGLFTGAVILSLGYRLFDIWLKGIEI